MISAAIVDDEPPARREIRRMLDEAHDVRVVGEAAGVDAARGLLLRTRPDVVFLDISLGRDSGFDLISDVDPATAIVFVTAFDEFAVRAFEANALDYLVKPVEPGRLEACLEKLRRAAADIAPAATLFSNRKWIFLGSGERPEFIEITNIAVIRAESGATRVLTTDGVERATTRTLLQWEDRLPVDDFVRLHRSTFVNLKHVQRVEPWSNYSYRVFVRGSTEPVIMSRRYAARLQDWLS